MHAQFSEFAVYEYSVTSQILQDNHVLYMPGAEVVYIFSLLYITRYLSSCLYVTIGCMTFDKNRNLCIPSLGF